MISLGDLEFLQVNTKVVAFLVLEQRLAFEDIQRDIESSEDCKYQEKYLRICSKTAIVLLTTYVNLPYLP